MTESSASRPASTPGDRLRALVLAAIADLGKLGLPPTEKAVASIASLVVNASRLGAHVDEVHFVRLSEPAPGIPVGYYICEHCSDIPSPASGNTCAHCGRACVWYARAAESLVVGEPTGITSAEAPHGR